MHSLVEFHYTTSATDRWLHERFFRKAFRSVSTSAIIFVLLSVAARAQSDNTAYGNGALASVTTGDSNSAFGVNALVLLTTGSDNTAVGYLALQLDEQGLRNTAVGSTALFANKASDNTAVGDQALFSNTSGARNTAVGSSALAGQVAFGGAGTTTGTDNTAIGLQALRGDTTGSNNTASGSGALLTNTIGYENTAAGSGALFLNTTGYHNSAEGVRALHNNTNAHDNTANGWQALANNTTGSANVAIGSNAGINLTTGSNNIIIGNNVFGAAGEANKIRIGKSGVQTATFIAGIHGKAVLSASGIPVLIDNTGHLGTVKSSARYKEQIKPMDKASEAILKLEPVSFRYKEELDPGGVRQFGLIAEQVEKVEPDLVIRGEDGKVDTVRYEAVNAMLLNEFIKEHRKVREQETAIAELKTALARQQKQIQALGVTVQKISQKFERTEHGRRVVSNE